MVCVVSQSKSQLHNVFLVIILHNSPDVQKNINGFIFDRFIFVIQQLVKHPKDFSGSLVLLSLCALLLHKLDKWDELVQQSNLDLCDLAGQDVQRHHQTVNEESLFNFVCEVHQALCEIKFVIVVEILYIGLDRLLGRKHTIARVCLVRLCVGVLGHLFKGLHSSLKPHFCLFNILTTSLSCLELRINLVCLLIFEVQEFFVN